MGGGVHAARLISPYYFHGINMFFGLGFHTLNVRNNNKVRSVFLQTAINNYMFAERLPEGSAVPSKIAPGQCSTYAVPVVALVSLDRRPEESLREFIQDLLNPIVDSTGSAGSKWTGFVVAVVDLHIQRMSRQLPKLR